MFSSQLQREDRNHCKSNLRQHVAAIFVPGDDGHFLHFAPLQRVVDDRDDKIDRAPDHALLRRIGCFAYQRLKSVERLRCAIRVQRRDAARMSGIPTLEQGKSSRSITDFADDNSVWLQPQSNFQALQLIELRRRQHAQAVGGVEQKLLRVLNYEHPVTWRQRANLFENGVRNRRLARAGSADDQYVFVGEDGLLNDFKVVKPTNRDDEVFLL